MSRYFTNIYDTVNTLWTGMRITFRHMMNIRRDNVTLQYPEERWPRPERNIGFNHEDYNVIRSRLHVDIDDCIGCYRCERACPVDCIKIDTIKSDRGEDIPTVKHTGVTSNGTKKGLLLVALRLTCLNVVIAIYVLTHALKSAFLWLADPTVLSIQ